VIRPLITLHLGFLQTPPHGDARRYQLGIFDLLSASTFVNMFNTLTGFTYRGLSPHKPFGLELRAERFKPPGIGIFDMPGVYQRMHLPKSVHDPSGDHAQISPVIRSIMLLQLAVKINSTLQEGALMPHERGWSRWR
jgi:hypothetical protein